MPTNAIKANKVYFNKNNSTFQIILKLTSYLRNLFFLGIRCLVHICFSLYYMFFIFVVLLCINNKNKINCILVLDDTYNTIHCWFFKQKHRPRKMAIATTPTKCCCHLSRMFPVGVFIQFNQSTPKQLKCWVHFQSI